LLNQGEKRAREKIEDLRIAIWVSGFKGLIGHRFVQTKTDKRIKEIISLTV
jgi:hypothetical protein